MPSSFPLTFQIPIAVSGVRGMGFLMKHHIETGGGQLPAKLSSLFIKVSGAAWLVKRTRDQKTPEVCSCAPGTLRVACRAGGSLIPYCRDAEWSLEDCPTFLFFFLPDFLTDSPIDP